MKKLTKHDFIERSRSIHGDKYDYDIVDYKNNSTKVDIKCNNCGDIFTISPHHHLRGQGCKPCSIKRFSDIKRYTTNQFIERSRSIHGNKYDYSLVKYVNKETKVTIVCPIHGEFDQKPSNHYRYGCNQCGYLLSSKTQKRENTYFINNAHNIHNNKYGYIITEDQTHRDKITIICPIHGEFDQKLGNHIYKQYGCPKCASHISKQEIELQEWLSEHIDITTNDRTLIAPLELDIVIPSKKIAIEYNGVYWHSEQRGKDKNYHLNKYNLCKDRGYRLIQIWENEWLCKKDIVKSIILSAIGVFDKKIHGRKCEIRCVDSNESKIMYDNNHIQGFQSGIHHGLYYNDELVSLMTVKYYKKTPILERFVNKRETLVHGGFSKLLKSFDNIGGMVTFSDPRYFTGNVYENNGFDIVGLVKPNYWYFKINTFDITHRRRYQKHMLDKKLDVFDPMISEYQNMLMNNYDRIWDCGNMKYIYRV